MNTRIFLVVIVVIAIVAVLVGIAATVAGAGGSYSVKMLVSDKIASANVFEGIVTEQGKGKTSILGDKIVVRVLSTTKAFNKSKKAQKAASWLGALQNGDYVTATGEYKKSDSTFEAQQIVNRSR